MIFAHHLSERSAIEDWLKSHSTSPVDEGVDLSSKVLIASRKTRGAIENLLESGNLEAAMCASWAERKKGLQRGKARELLKAGQTEQAAELGLPEAQGIMADIYYEGKVVEQDFDKCFEWATKAAEGGDTWGQFRLGWAYSEGEGCRKDFAQAIKWFKKTVESGEYFAFNNIGTMYLRGGYGIEKDLTEAVAWYQRASDERNDFSAQCNLAKCNLRG